MIEEKVRMYLKESVALDTLWYTPVTADMLEAEWARIRMGSRLPQRLDDDDIDRIAALPGTLTGAVTVRVVDSDHTAGHQNLDTVSIDEIWIRAVP